MYTRVQNEDGLAMEAPITFRVRVRVDALAKKVTWMEDARDARGVEDRSIRTYGGFSFSRCEVFDQMNWSCTLRGPSDGQVLEKPEMKDGQLSRFTGPTLSILKDAAIYVPMIAAVRRSDLEGALRATERDWIHSPRST